MNLDTTNWKEFVLGRLFIIKKGKRLTSADQEDGCNNYIGAIDSNNGIANHIAQAPIHKGNTISLSYNGSVGEAFYQKDPYWATDDVNALYSKYEGFNELIGLFIATVLRQEKYKFSYGRKWTLDNMNITIIKLPVQRNEDGAFYIDPSKKYSDDGYVPDWQYMKDYIKSLHHKPLTTGNKNSNILKLKVDEWKEFGVNKLFSISIAKSADIGNLEEGETPFVGRTDINNGIQGLVEPKGITKGQCITISMVGTNVALYQEKDFQASQNIAVLRNKNLTPHSALFVCSMINFEMKLKYSYGRTVGKGNIENMILRLPILRNPDGTIVIDGTNQYSEKGYVPDWGFMENYIKSLPYGDRL